MDQARLAMMGQGVRIPPPGRPVSLADRLVADVAEGLRVLRLRDGLQVTDEQCLERARNIVCGLIGNYKIEENSDGI
jgi:hypothetical protein